MQNGVQADLSRCVVDDKMGLRRRDVKMHSRNVQWWGVEVEIEEERWIRLV